MDSAQARHEASNCGSRDPGYRECDDGQEAEQCHVSGHRQSKPLDRAALNLCDVAGKIQEAHSGLSNAGAHSHTQCDEEPSHDTRRAVSIHYGPMNQIGLSDRRCAHSAPTVGACDMIGRASMRFS